jgi:hypothetical protein
MDISHWGDILFISSDYTLTHSPFTPSLLLKPQKTFSLTHITHSLE